MENKNTTPELTDWDFEFLEKHFKGNRNSGMIVITAKGTKGKVFSHEDPVNGKLVVHTEKGKLLCKAEGLTLKGYFD